MLDQKSSFVDKMLSLIYDVSKVKKPLAVALSDDNLIKVD